MTLSKLELEHLPISQLRAAERNPRTHSPAQIRQIARSIREFGFTNPVLIDPEGRIIAGHGRVEAARQIGLTEVPTVRIDGLTPAQLRAYALADNKLAENAGWDRDLLALELQYIVELDISLDIDLTGFQPAEIDILLTTETTVDPDDDEDRIEPDPGCRRSPAPVTSGSSGPTASSAATLPARSPTPSCSGTSRHTLCSPIRRTTYPFRGTSAGWARLSIASSRWPPVRCRPSSSPGS